MQAHALPLPVPALPVLALALLVAALFAPKPALAVMPEHLTGSVPEDGGVLATETILLQGYSLYRPGPDQLEITDLAADQAADWEVEDLNCELEGDMERAETDDGAVQYRCDLLIRLVEPVPGHEYELRFLGEAIRFTYEPGR